MEKEEMDITPQDIIDKEFRVKFRGFDMAEVDAFLEEVAENLFKLTEENTLLHEKILAMERDLEAAGTSPAAPLEFPPELGLLLEDLKQDTEAVGAGLASLRQDRQDLDALKTSLEKIIVSLEEKEPLTSGNLEGQSTDLADILEEIKKGSTGLNAELNSLREERLSSDSLKKNLEEALAAVQQELPALTSAGPVAVSDNLEKTMEDFKKGSETLHAELDSLKKEIANLSEMRTDIKAELQNVLSDHFAKLETSLSAASASAFQPEPAKSVPETREKLVAATVIDEPEDLEEHTRVPEEAEEEEEEYDSSLDLLSEDDILDVDKLRGLYQSILDDSISDGQTSRDVEDANADLLFFEDDFLEDQHEPQVTFSLDENKTPTDQK